MQKVFKINNLFHLKKSIFLGLLNVTLTLQASTDVYYPKVVKPENKIVNETSIASLSLRQEGNQKSHNKRSLKNSTI